MTNPWVSGGGARGQDYDERWARLAASGHDVHGEASLVESLGPHSVLDAGCGTGRVAIELARRGLEVIGVDIDPSMLEAARVKAPDLVWVEADLAAVRLDRTFDAVVMAGNVMIFLSPGTEATVIGNLAGHLAESGLVIAGFQLGDGRLSLDAYDAYASAAGLRLEHRWATWDRQPLAAGGDYAVSVHRKTKP